MQSFTTVCVVVYRLTMQSEARVLAGVLALTPSEVRCRPALVFFFLRPCVCLYGRVSAHCAIVHRFVVFPVASKAFLFLCFEGCSQNQAMVVPVV